MALMVTVRKIRNNDRDSFLVNSVWEDGYSDTTMIVEKEPGMTAAESIEWYFLKSQMVASWFWYSQQAGGETSLHGQFVHSDISGPSYKEVRYSNAHCFDL